jgi:uncharacterized protein
MQWPLDLLDWKRRIAGMYADVRTSPPSAETLGRFRAAKDDLFATHAQSPLPPQAGEPFRALAYYPYRPDLRVAAPLDCVESDELLELPSSTDEPFRFALIGHVNLVLQQSELRLAVFWLTSYGGGIFIPFRDTTAADTTYGAGRYLIDTVKGADLGTTDTGSLVLDFNYAFNPSCSYDPRWSCPLAPLQSRVDIPIEAGERLWHPPAGFT